MSGLQEFVQAVEALEADDIDGWADKLLIILDVRSTPRTLAIARHGVMVIRLLHTDASLMDLEAQLVVADPSNHESLLDSIQGVGEVMLDECMQKADESWEEVQRTWGEWR